MSAARPRLAFISPVFLFPADTGGRIRTTNILRGLKGGAFDITLLGPADAEQARRWAPQLGELCDRFVPWQPSPVRPRWRRAWDLLGPLPVNVVADRTQAALRAVKRDLEPGAFDVVVFDFVHAAVLLPAELACASVCFTHNVEAEIFARHAEQARGALMRAVWSAQCEKMQGFEARTLPRFTTVIAVSERDAALLSERYGVVAPAVIPTGVDLEYFAWRTPLAVGATMPPTVVFTGSMDWDANIDGVRHFIDHAWPLIHRRLPSARFVVVGRNPPASLVERGRSVPGVTFTGLVDDVRPYVYGAHVFIIPLRVGGGTRIKAFEAMAMGCPVVSTAIGIEGLSVQAGEHYLLRDAAAEQADAVLTLLGDPSQCHAISVRARQCVEARFGHRVAALVFERICLEARDKYHGRADMRPQGLAITT